MSVRGYTPWLDEDGNPIYEEFTIDSKETVRLTINEKIGTADPTPVDLSSSSLKIYFRASIAGSATIGVSQELTNVNTGTDGIVSGDVTFREADFPNAIGEGASAIVEKAAVLVNESVADANTPTGFEETVWQGVAQVFLRRALHDT